MAALSLTAAACGSSGDESDQAAPTSAAEASDTSAPNRDEAPAATDTTAASAATPSTAAPTTTVAPGPCEGGGAGSGALASTLTSGSLEYAYDLFVPSSYDHTPIPLVMEFHGLGSSGPGQSGFSGYSALAIKEGFAVVSPTGLPGEGDDRNSWELAQLDVAGRDDVQMASDLIDEIAAQLCIDESRVYATGLSNGGYFSALLACELSDRIAATFSVAAISHPDGCEPTRPVAMGAIHGTADEVVPFAGGGSVLLTDDLDPEVRATFEEFFDQVMPDEAAEFAADFACATVVEESIGVETMLTRYTDCEGGVEVRFYAVEGGGHTWPGSSLAEAFASSLGYPTEDIDATADGWAFMSQYSLPD